MLEVKVSIDLGGADVRMAEQFLDAAEIVARLEQVRRERVPEQVRVDAGIDALPLGPVQDPGLYRAGAQPAAPLAQEQGAFLCRGQRPALGQPSAERFPRVAADRHDAVLVALAGHRHGAVIQIEVTDIQSRQLGKPQP